MSRQVIKFSLVFFVGILLFACAKREKPVLVAVPLEEETDNDKLTRVKDKELVLRIDSLYKLRPKTFYSKIETSYRDTTQSFDFRTNVRMIVDSVTHTLIKKGPLPLAAGLVRKDSVFISNKIQSCYMKRDLNYLKEQFGYDFNLANLEELILGLPLGFDTTQRYYRFNDKNNYVISTNKKRELRRELKGKDPLFQQNNRDSTDEDNISIRYFLNDELNAIKRIIIDSPDENTHIYIDYIGRELIEGFLIPTEVKLFIQLPRNVLYINMLYSGSEVNQEVEINFFIPEDDKECGKN